MGGNDFTALAVNFGFTSPMASASATVGGVRCGHGGGADKRPPGLRSASSRIMKIEKTTLWSVSRMRYSELGRTSSRCSSTCLLDACGLYAWGKLG